MLKYLSIGALSYVYSALLMLWVTWTDSQNSVKTFEGVPNSLVAMQDQPVFPLQLQCFPQGTDNKFAGDVLVCYTGNHAAVIKFYDDTVMPHILVLQEQVREVRTPFLIWSISTEVLFQPVFEHFVGLPRSISRFLGWTIERRPNSIFMYLWIFVQLYLYPLRFR